MRVTARQHHTLCTHLQSVACRLHGQESEEEPEGNDADNAQANGSSDEEGGEREERALTWKEGRQREQKQVEEAEAEMGLAAARSQKGKKKKKKKQWQPPAAEVPLQIGEFVAVLAAAEAEVPFYIGKVAAVSASRSRKQEEGGFSIWWFGGGKKEYKPMWKGMGSKGERKDAYADKAPAKKDKAGKEWTWEKGVDEEQTGEAVLTHGFDLTRGGRIPKYVEDYIMACVKATRAAGEVE